MKKKRPIMKHFDAEGHSFVVRLWREHDDEARAADDWRGWIDHVASGERRYFRTFEDISLFIAACLSQPPENADTSQAATDKR